MSGDLPASGEKHSVHYVKDGNYSERWRKEFIKNKKYEADLTEVSKIFYEEVDYTHHLESAPFPELALNNYDHLYGQAEREIQSKYFIPITARVGLFMVLGIVLIVFFNMTMLLIITALSGSLAASLYYTKKKQSQELLEANTKVTADIARRHAEETRLYNESKAQYEEAENERISLINRLLDGSESAIGDRLLEAFKTLKLPVMVEADILYRQNIPLVKVWLPSKAVVPHQTCELLPSGKLQYKDKDNNSLNKQYFELCSAIIIQLMLIVLGNIPSFEYGYAWGMAKGADTDDCLMTIEFSKETATDVGRVGSALSALQLINSTYKLGIDLFMTPIEMILPPEWGEDFEIHNISNVNIKIYNL